MSNITGGPLDKWVQNQIEIRQQIIGNNPEALSEIGERVLYNNNRNAWVRLASSVNITKNDFKLTNSDIPQGDSLSKNYVLFGGVNFKPGVTQGGVVPSQEIQNSLVDPFYYSYGLGGNEQGYQPLPGLDSVKISHVNRGAIRKFDIRLRVHNRIQLEIIETLYLRLGYYMLLEWGHTSYVNSNNEFTTSPEYNTPAFNTFYEKDKVDNDVVDAISEHRRETAGNYDGALLKVDNFSWNLETDGSYSISISGVSKGGLLDSLLLNYPSDTNTVIKNYIVVNPNKTEKERILRNLGESNIPDGLDLNKHYSQTISNKLAEGNYDRLFNLGAIQLPNEFENQEKLNISFTNELDNDNTITILNQKKSALNEKLFNYHKNLKQANWIKVNGKDRYKNVDGLITLKFDNPNNPSDGYAYNYITLGRLLNEIQSILDPEEGSPDSTLNNNVPIKIDSEVEKNFMFTHWFQHSADPSICLIPFEYVQNDGSKEQLLSNILGTGFRVGNEDKTQFQGKIMNIHVNMEWVAKCLQNSTQADSGEISLYEFLDKLMNGTQKALGGINNLNVTYIEDTNEGGGLTIFDDTIIPGLPEEENSDPNSNEIALRLFGVRPNDEGSFVRNISTQSKITSKMATQIAIGSTASGVNNSTTLLSRWNEGMEDRLQASSVAATTTNTNEKLLESINKKYEKYIEFIQETYVNFKHPSPSVSQTAQSNLKYLLEYDLGVKTLNGNLAGKGFIPIDLSLELDGISGILLYQRIKTSEEILPYSYNNKVNFIVQAMDHTIQNNEWTTTLSTLAVPKKTDLSTNRETSGFDLLNLPTNNN